MLGPTLLPWNRLHFPSQCFGVYTFPEAARCIFCPTGILVSGLRLGSQRCRGRVRTRLASLRPLVDPCFCSQKPEATAGMCSMLRGTLSIQPTSLSMPSRAQRARTISATGSRSTLQSAACARSPIRSGYGCCPTAAGTRLFLLFGRYAVVWPRHRFLGTFLSLFLSSSHVAGNRLRLRLPVDTRSASQPHLSMRRP